MILLDPIHSYAGDVLRFFGRYHEEEKARYGQLRIWRNHNGNSDDPHIARLLGNLGSVYMSLGKLDETERAKREFLDMMRAIFGQNVNHPAIAIYLGSIGNMYKLLGKFSEAEAMHRESLNMMRATYGHNVNHPGITSTLNNLGDVYHFLGKMEEAEIVQRECLDMNRAINGVST